jgi:peptidoglycan hydrolase-like protein with peptidoglycan-binding domain
LRALRDSLNQWRAIKGQGQITETRGVGPQTHNAVKQFQQDSGMKIVDGVPGPRTKERLKLLLELHKYDSALRVGVLPVSDWVTHDDFRQLDSQTQTETLRRMLSYGKNRAPDNIGFVMVLAGKLASVSLPPLTQKMVLDVLATRPDDVDILRYLISVVSSPAFSSLGLSEQSWLLNRIASYGPNYSWIANLLAVLASSRKLSKETRGLTFRAHADKPDDATLVECMRIATDEPIFRQQDQALQTEILKRIISYPSDEHYATNLMSIVQEPGFTSLSPAVRNEIWKGLPSRFGPNYLNSTAIKNMMTLAAALGFSSLLPELQSLMLDLQAARANNTQLTFALANLASDPKLRDLKTGRQAITLVNNSIP